MRMAIPINTQKRLWATSQGCCQNTACGKFLLKNINGNEVNLGQMCHMVSYSSDGPRGEVEMSIMERNDFSNLLLLCMDCHKIIDDNPELYPLHLLNQWKLTSQSLLRRNKKSEEFSDEKSICSYIINLLKENETHFLLSGPLSEAALKGESGDSEKVWNYRCIDTIIPNNRIILSIVESNSSKLSVNFLDAFFEFKAHALAFESNKIFNEKINDYPLFPQKFCNYLKFKIGEISSFNLDELKTDEAPKNEHKSFSWVVEKNLKSHKQINIINQQPPKYANIGLKDGRKLRVYFCSTYYISEFTVLTIYDSDPSVNVILCSKPYSDYSKKAKKLCIDLGIGLFKPKAFMGALWHKDMDYINYLSKADITDRIRTLNVTLQSQFQNSELQFYVFGSYLRFEYYNDIDLFVVYQKSPPVLIEINNIKLIGKRFDTEIDLIVCSEEEFEQRKMVADNCERVL